MQFDQHMHQVPMPGSETQMTGHGLQQHTTATPVAQQTAQPAASATLRFPFPFPLAVVTPVVGSIEGAFVGE